MYTYRQYSVYNEARKKSLNHLLFHIPPRAAAAAAGGGEGERMNGNERKWMEWFVRALFTFW